MVVFELGRRVCHCLRILFGSHSDLLVAVAGTLQHGGLAARRPPRDVIISVASLASSPPSKANSRWSAAVSCLAPPVNLRRAAPVCGGGRVLSSPDGPPVMTFMYAAGCLLCAAFRELSCALRCASCATPRARLRFDSQAHTAAPYIPVRRSELASASPPPWKSPKWSFTPRHSPSLHMRIRGIRIRWVLASSCALTANPDFERIRAMPHSYAQSPLLVDPISLFSITSRHVVSLRTEEP